MSISTENKRKPYQTFSVFTNNKHIQQLLVRKSRRINGFDGTNVGIKIQVLTKSNNGRRVTGNFVRRRAKKM
jgi:hypothetical protein